MKSFLPALALALCVPALLSAQSPATNASETNVMKLLRLTIAEQTRNPDKIIRTYTNFPPEQAQLTAPAPVRTAEPPPVKAEPPVAKAEPPVAKSEPPVVKAEPPVAKSEPPVAKSEPPRTTLTPKAATAAALERQYLDGKLSARAYQKALADLERANNPAADPASKSPPASPKTSRVAPSPQQPAIATPASQPSARQQKISEVESKLDEMLRQKEARERAAQTNSVPAPADGKLTKRQRLDFLLKQVVDGKLSDEEYKKERDKILAEPD